MGSKACSVRAHSPHGWSSALLANFQLLRMVIAAEPRQIRGLEQFPAYLAAPSMSRPSAGLMKPGGSLLPRSVLRRTVLRHALAINGRRWFISDQVSGEPQLSFRRTGGHLVLRHTEVNTCTVTHHPPSADSSREGVGIVAKVVARRGIGLKSEPETLVNVRWSFAHTQLYVIRSTAL